MPDSGFCSEECRDIYWPKKKTFAELIKERNELRSASRPKLNYITLKCNIDVWLDMESKKTCDCGSEIYFATTDKNKRPMPVEKVEGGWDTHFATCQKIKDKRMQDSFMKIFDKSINYKYVYIKE